MTLLIEPGKDGTSIFNSSDQLEEGKVLIEEVAFCQSNLCTNISKKKIINCVRVLEVYASSFL